MTIRKNICFVFCFFILFSTVLTQVGFSKDESETDDILRLPRTGQISAYNEIGKAVDFSGSGQDGEFQRGTVWPEPRFIVNNDGTVIDNLTGLMWLKQGDCFGKLPWVVALSKIDELNQLKYTNCKNYTANFNDWTLPNINQLASLVNSEWEVPADYLKLEGISDFQTENYWSSTSYQNMFNAWVVDFHHGEIYFENKLKEYFVIPVRIFDQQKGAIASSGQNNSYAAFDDGAYRSGVQKFSGRFVDNMDGTITDNMTGLMWLQDASCLKDLSWQASIDTINILNTNPVGLQCLHYSGKYQDWVLPNRIELRTLVNYSTDYPAIRNDHLFKKITEFYWTSTTSIGHTDKAYYLNTNIGELRRKPKIDLLSSIPVRSVVPVKDRPRKETKIGSELAVKQEYVMETAAEFRNEIQWPPAPRFLDNSDGTSLDVVTGLIWLKDANCFGKYDWKESFETIQKFNLAPQKYTCQDYQASFGDWQMPSLEELQELLNKEVENSAEWLNSQGVINVQASGDYWTTTETVFNLYFANVVNLKHGGIRNYPKNLKFFLWPHREVPSDEKREPLLNLTINSLGGPLSLSADEPISAALYLHNFALRYPSDFWVWYDTPDENQLWLSSIRLWRDEPIPLYQGDLCNLRNYEIFRSDNNNLAPGVYTFHFAVDFNQDGLLDKDRYEVQVVVNIQ